MRIRSITAPNPGPFTLDGTRTYLLGRSTVLDPGPAIGAHVEAILEAMPHVETILITHRHKDHAPAALALKRRTGAQVVAPPGVLTDEVVDRRVTGAEHLHIEAQSIEVLATPGHTREHVCYLTPEGDLFTGDTILGFGTTTIFPPDGHMGDYLQSLKMLRARGPRRIHPGHGPTHEDAPALIDEYIAHRLFREQQVLDALAGRPFSIEELRERIYPDLDHQLTGAAEIQLTAHLIKLEEEGRVVRRNGVYGLVS
jgi:glyoxylase-like metal-dependent hydrolase (beta-lactamase superfamily II)